MKKLSLILILFVVVFTISSCKKKGDDTNKNQELIVGKWQSTSAKYFEIYYSDGTGKMWNEDEDVSEDEADTFTWAFATSDETKFTQTINFHSGAASLPQSCNVVTLNESSFVYNNDGWRRTENLKRIQ